MAIFTAAVKNGETVNIQGHLGARAIRILQQIQGLRVLKKHGKPHRRAVATIHYAGARARVWVEVKQRANTALAWHLVQQARQRPGTPLLLIADETTAEARRILQEHGIAVVDGLGNVHIALPGLLVRMGGPRAARKAALRTPPTRLSGKAGVVAQALLLDPGRAWQLDDLAEAAKVSVGLAHRVMERLEKVRAVTAEGAGPNRVRRLTAPSVLLDLWLEELAEPTTVTLAYALAQTPRQLIRALGANLETAGIEHALTGAAGASVIALFVTAIPVVELWVPAKAAPEDLCDAAKAERVTDGHNVAFLQGKDDTPLAFHEKIEDLWLANRFRLYADLRRDPRRGREQADHLRREIMGF